MPYSAARKGDRKKMAQEVYNVLAKCNDIKKLEIVPEGNGHYDSRRTQVLFETNRGIRVNVSFDGASDQDRQGMFCLPWNMGLDTDACMSDLFARAVNDTLNTHHFRKCTTFGHGFADLIWKLNNAIECINSGDAYDAEREAASIAKHGTWQERRARWNQTWGETANGTA